MKPILAIVALLLICGCHHNEARNMNRPSIGESAERQAQTLDDYVSRVQTAWTPAAEADAIRRLHQYETDHGLTYTVQTLRTYDNAAVPSASAGSQPVKAQVTIYRGREVVKTFTFVPRDNRNLALLGE